MKRCFVMVLAALTATFGIAACGDDDESDLAAYCELTAALDDQEDFPSDAQLDEIQDVAPAEIRDEVDLVVERFKEANDDPATMEEVFNDPEVQEAFGVIEAYEDENCPAREAEDDGVEDDEAGDATTTTTEELEEEPEEATTTTTVDDVTEDTTETTTTD